MQITEAIIIGGGKSIAEGISLGLKDKIKNKFVILINYAYKHFDGTCLTFGDKDFYVPLYAKKEPIEHPDINEELKKMPLIIGMQKNTGLDKFLYPNTILIDYPKTNFKKCPLTGLFTLAIAEKLEPKRIFILGYDWNRQPVPKDKSKYSPFSDLDIHYYGKEILHRGLGYTGFYDRHNPNNYFKFFNNSNAKIYNVSPNSNIQNFEKIDYPTMFKLLSSKIYNQEELRKIIKKKIK